MSYFKRVCELTDSERKQASEMVGKMQLWILEGRSIDYMAEKLKLEPQYVMENIFEVAYEFQKKIGTRTYLKILLYKRKHK